MQTRLLGEQGLAVSGVGLGCMGMSDFYGSHEPHDSFATLSQALNSGVTFWDTSDIYGPKTNELLLGRYFKKHPRARNNVTLATKFGIVRDNSGNFIEFNGRPEYVKHACDASLRRLGVDCIDLYYQHRMDPNVPIEDTVGAMADLVKLGKVRYLGLSEAGVDSLTRACRVHPISALQSEYSLWSRDIEGHILPACNELGIGLVAYSPLGRGFLTGAFTSRQDFEPGDWRLNNPRFTEQNLSANLALVDEIKAIAHDVNCTPAQLALAWVLHQSQNYVCIPGTRSPKRVMENAGAMALKRTGTQWKEIAERIDKHKIHGLRYPLEAMRALGR
ncbi:Aldo-keto reductase IolS [Paraglaciecola mesophila]|uniref:Aldo-keto reductase IolS n=1 Tax=Paraglaciecola mesophila TaxID=197222 RepID=A0A857JGR8_9ALTE|nr:aldo/keto reductase [Paraglaciecola mesophila]QHJ10452.1 Aldo-keto reductase IolS [Paraglaciecola mesophila]